MIAVKNGKFISEGEPIEVMTASNLREVFNIEAQIVSDPIYHKPVCITYDIIKNGTPIE
jgi:iron complex transport system ATP-binding protein